MGNCCETCLKNNQLLPFEQAALILSDSKIAEHHPQERCTRMLQTGFYHQNTTFYVTTQAIEHFQSQYLLIFTDNILKILRNPFIRELGANIKGKLESRLEYLKDKISFCQAGHYVNITDPFDSKIKIRNLTIIWIELFDNKTKSAHHQKKMLKKAVETCLGDIAQLTTDCFSLGIIELSYFYGYPLSLFREIVKNRIQQISQTKKQVSIAYFAQNQQNIEAFLDTILGPHNDMTMTMTLAKSHASSSYY